MRNIVLTLILLSLVTVAYFIDEKSSREELISKEKQEKLFNQEDLGALVKISGQNLNLNLKTFKLENGFEISVTAIDSFLARLEKIKVRRIFSAEESLNFKEFKTNSQLHLEFENGNVTLLIGPRIEYDTSFYMKVITNLNQTKNEKWTLAKYEGELESQFNVVANDSEKKSIEYNEVQSMFYYDNRKFLKLNPFENLKISDIEVLDANAFKKYAINFSNYTTNPSPPDEIQYELEHFKTFILQLSQLRADEISLAEYKSEKIISYFRVNGKEFKLSKMYNKKPGLYLISDSFVYELENQNFEIFNRPVTYFWKNNVFGNYSLQIFDNKDSILNMNNSLYNKLMKIGKSEAQKIYPSSELANWNYKVRAGNHIFLVKNSEDGVLIFDQDKKVIFQFLDKLE